MSIFKCKHKLKPHKVTFKDYGPREGCLTYLMRQCSACGKIEVKPYAGNWKIEDFENTEGRIE